MSSIIELSPLETFFLYLLIVILAPVFLIDIKNDTKHKKIRWFLAWSILTIPAAIRYETGVDWVAYEEAYNAIIKAGSVLNSNYNIEISFKILSLISHFLTNSSILLFSFYAGATNFFFLLGIYRFREQVSCGWAVYIYASLLYFPQYNIGRQYLAIAVIFSSFCYIVERKPIKFMGYVLIATFFHSTALLAVFLYLYGIGIEKKKYRKLMNLLFYLAPAVLLIFLDTILQYALILLGNSKYTSYANISSYSFGLGIIIQLLWVLVISFSYAKNKCNMRNDALIAFSFRTYILASLFYLLQYMLGNFGGRIYLYFIPIEIIIIGAIMRREGKQKNTALTFNFVQLFIILYSNFLFIHSVLTNSQGHVPYQFRFFL